MSNAFSNSSLDFRRIDLHHHIFPSNYSKSKADLSSSVGFRTPSAHLPWTPDLSLRAMDALAVRLAVLSVPAGYPHACDAVAREKTRDVNAQMHSIVKEPKNDSRFAFWGCLGDWRDVEGALEMIPYAMEELNAVGIAIASSYGQGADAKYVGDNAFDPIWEELDKRRAIVFLHGSQTPASTPMPHPALGLPITEVPHETFKAISQLIVSGKTRRFPNIAFVLAHMGGSTLALASRVAALSHYMDSPLSEADILAELRKCWWDTALGAGETTLSAAEALGVGERIVWGSDFPAVPLDSISWFDRSIDAFYAGNEARLRGVFQDNALKLFESRNICVLKPA
ncbi:amidohydrolase 2 [Auriscalpium vulgare]|uniref:Amidohydrolase 2 n=1 Tax=Auriscalpium vulgare TaxID=40419 RepID=A0ACB8SBI9_9AGAM|nr:amidohydrolase 2 [Auriscalpium vulgare]